MSTAASPMESVPALREDQRRLYTFIAPSKTMADLRRNASWWVPWPLISIVSIAFVYTVDKKIGWSQVIETQVQSNAKQAERVDKLPPEQQQKIYSQYGSFYRIAGYASPVFTLVMLVVISGALVGLFNFGFGARLRFRETMGIAAYGYLPSIINSLLIITVMFFVAPDAFDIKSPIACNAGYFVPSTMPFLKGLLGAFDVFTFWQVFLMAVGVSQMSKVKKNTAFVAIFGLVLLVKVLGAAASSM